MTKTRMSLTDVIRKEFETRWRRAKRRDNIVEFYEEYVDASGLFDHEIVGDKLVVKPNYELLGKTKHELIVIDDPESVSYFCHRLRVDGYEP